MKKEKILILGGLGYIGFELCRLYSGETRCKDITVIDNKFFSGRIQQLKDWGFKFIQSDMLNCPVLQRELKNSDIVHHFAGITDVPKTIEESDSTKNEIISKIGIDGTQYILDNIPEKCKLIFPSTHVVFEGLKNEKFLITEEETPLPVLEYSKVKLKNENDIINQHNKYIILRLASVYGASDDNTRMNIMPNLFSKFAASGSDITLFGGGKQHKSLVSVIDVARAFKFFAESNIKNQTFNVSNENTTVKDVGEICKKYNPNISLIETDDDIPNLGYTLSNVKLLSTGFKFLYNIDDSIKDMIYKWSDKNKPSSLEYVIHGKNDFVDVRGKISNYELTEPINLIGYINSKKGTVRANHYHPIQEQKCLLVSGKYISVTKDLSDSNSIIQTRIINSGEIAVIQPNVAHTMVFIEDSVFLNLVRGDRDHENYGITHTIPYTLVDDNFRDELLKNYMTTCRCTGDDNLKPVISLGLSPLANNLINSPNESIELYPLEMVYCPESHNCQLSHVVPAEKMFDNYLYVSSTAKTFRDHFENASKKYISKYSLDMNSLVVDIGSNDGIALYPFKNENIRVVGIEPANNIAKIANDKGIDTINDYFNSETVDLILHKYGNADIVTASNVFAHADDLKSITQNVFRVLKQSGTFIIEVQYILDTIKDLTFDNIYHEHVNYWSVTSLNNFFNKLGYSIVDVEHVDTHGGSIRVYIQDLVESGESVNSSVMEFLEREKNFGLLDYKTYLKFATDVENVKKNVIKNINELKSKNYKLVGYGSPAKATTSLNYFGITSKEIDYIIEDNKLKYNKYIPGVNIPIYSKDKLNSEFPDVIIVMAWNFIDYIKDNNKDLIEKGVKFISIKDLQSDVLDL